MGWDTLWSLAVLPGALVVLFGLVGLVHRVRWSRAMAREAPGVRDLAAVVVDGEKARWTGDPDREYCIGSVTKGLTGLLLAEAISRGEVRADQALGELLDLGGVPAGSVTLADLAQHRSGLPSLTGRLGADTRATAVHLLGGDPYVWDERQVLDLARDARVGSRRYLYSNLGAALTGLALAAAAGRPYPELLRERVLEPLGMEATRVADEAHPPPRGTSRLGRPVRPWTLGGFAAAGGVVSSAADLRRLVAALADGSVPGAAATRPQGGSEEMGWFWMVDGRDQIWHNGQVGGFFAAVAVRRGGRGAAVMDSRTVPVTGMARRRAR